MLETDYTNRYGTDTTINEAGTGHEHGRSLEELILDLLQGEFAGVIRSHIRGEVYGGY